MSSAHIVKRKPISRTEDFDDPLDKTPIGLHRIPIVKNKVLYNKHKNRKNNEVVAAMYAMYCLPRSLEYIGKKYRRSRQTIYDLFKRRGYKLRSKEMKSLQVIDGINFTEGKGGYLRGTVCGKRILANHYVWEKHHGKIPAGYCIYYKDKNKKNNCISNLGILEKKNMGKFFNPNSNNQHRKKV